MQELDLVHVGHLVLELRLLVIQDSDVFLFDRFGIDPQVCHDSKRLILLLAVADETDLLSEVDNVGLPLLIPLGVHDLSVAIELQLLGLRAVIEAADRGDMIPPRFLLWIERHSRVDLSLVATLVGVVLIDRD